MEYIRLRFRCHPDPVFNTGISEVLHGACPERDSLAALLLQNDSKRRVQNDNP